MIVGLDDSSSSMSLAWQWKCLLEERCTGVHRCSQGKFELVSSLLTRGTLEV